MKKIGGIWESDTELISSWRKKNIANGHADEKKAGVNGKRRANKR